MESICLILPKERLRHSNIKNGINKKMKVIDTFIPDLKILIPDVYEDQRGYFYESFNKIKLSESGLHFDFIQDNQSKSSYGTIRGLHFQTEPYAQAKLVRVIEGEILDIAIDLRKNRETFGNVYSLKLSSVNRKQLLIPRGFAHGFGVLSEYAVVLYKIDNIYKPEYERGLKYNDAFFNINWEIPQNLIVLSEKDKKNEDFNLNETYFDQNNFIN
jgi:dTDP-4-dehydrorhamnose 3,5-epimerase